MFCVRGCSKSLQEQVHDLSFFVPKATYRRSMSSTHRGPNTYPYKTYDNTHIEVQILTRKLYVLRLLFLRNWNTGLSCSLLSCLSKVYRSRLCFCVPRRPNNNPTHFVCSFFFSSEGKAISRVYVLPPRSLPSYKYDTQDLMFSSSHNVPQPTLCSEAHRRVRMRRPNWRLLILMECAARVRSVIGYVSKTRDQ
jgi:hypothetical protein